jgi:hypothetical protein
VLIGTYGRRSQRSRLGSLIDRCLLGIDGYGCRLLWSQRSTTQITPAANPMVTDR